MRIFLFTLLAMAIAVGIHWLLEYWQPGIMTDTIHNLIYASHLLLPVIAAAGLAYVMRISNLGYVIFLAILSPVVSLILYVGFAVFVLNAPM